MKLTHTQKLFEIKRNHRFGFDWLHQKHSAIQNYLEFSDQPFLQNALSLRPEYIDPNLFGQFQRHQNLMISCKSNEIITISRDKTHVTPLQGDRLE